MTEDQVRKIAENLAVEQSLDACKIVAVRHCKRSEISEPKTVGDEWVVQFQFECDEDVSSNYALAIVDDANEEAHFFDSL